MRRRGEVGCLSQRAGAFTVVLAVMALLPALGGIGVHDVAGQVAGLEVKVVRFEGNEAFPDDSLARAIATQETECRHWLLTPACVAGWSLRRALLRDRELPRDQARLIIWYQRRGFRDVQVDMPVVVRESSKAEVIFRILEGAPVLAESVSFVGAEGLEVAGLLDDLPLAPGDRLSTLALDATSDVITDRLKNQGYAHAAVFRRTLRPRDDPYHAEVTFELIPGPAATYGAINVSGLENLSFGTVRRALQFSSGDTYRLDDVSDARRRLYGLDIIRSASVVPDTLDPEPSVDVDVVIQEGDAYRVRTGVGWSTSECLSLEARWSSRNFLGGGRVLQVRGRVGHLLAPGVRDVLCSQSGAGEFARLTWLTSVDLVQPWIFSTRNSLTTSIFAERQSLPDIFIRRAVGAQIAISRSVSRQTAVTGFFHPELSELDADDVLFCTGLLVCSPADIEALEGANWLSPIGVNFARDWSDDLLNPRTGYRLTVDVEHASRWTSSDFRYDRVVGEVTRYTPLGRSVVLATRVRGGWAGSGGFEGLVFATNNSTIVHPQKRFYAGGASSVRGFAQGQLGARVLDARVEDLVLDNSAKAPEAVPDSWGGCSPSEVADRTCEVDPDAVGRFEVRPIGGTRVLEANAEIRFALGTFLEGALFADVGQAWGQGQEILLRDLEFTPGLGIRFPSPVGPIRVDLAYQFRGEESLDAVTSQIRPYDASIDSDHDLIADGEGGMTPWVSTGELVFLASPVTFGQSMNLVSRLQLHVSIGQAF